MGSILYDARIKIKNQANSRSLRLAMPSVAIISSNLMPITPEERP